jgi:glycosyltransferase involved in cell wall biosynthesis
MFGQHDRTAMLKRESVLRADHVICISENTKRDLLEMVPVLPEKVSVVHLGFDQLTSSDKQANSNVSLEASPYLLFVGGRGDYKNFNGLLHAYASSKWLTQNFRIVCIGDGKLRVEELALMRELGISSLQVIQINADDDLLAEYYRSAAAFIYPSKYEGFGIPPLEAMSLKCPVICSNTSSIPEVVGDAGEYFEPDSVDSMRAAIERVLQRKERREYLVQKGIERCAAFSWARCASETLAIYRSII